MRITRQRKLFPTPGNGNVERGLDLAQVLVQRACEASQALVVDGGEGDVQGRGSARSTQLFDVPIESASDTHSAQ